MTWWRWRRKLEQADEAVLAAEGLRDRAEAQQQRAERIAPRVAALSDSLQKLHTENHIGPMIEAILRGGE